MIAHQTKRVQVIFLVIERMKEVHHDSGAFWLGKPAGTVQCLVERFVHVGELSFLRLVERLMQRFTAEMVLQLALFGFVFFMQTFYRLEGQASCQPKGDEVGGVGE
jgi:hypothetical protein